MFLTNHLQILDYDKLNISFSHRGLPILVLYLKNYNVSFLIQDKFQYLNVGLPTHFKCILIN